MYQTKRDYRRYLAFCRGALVLVVMSILLAPLTSTAVAESVPGVEPAPAVSDSVATSRHALEDVAQNLGWPATIVPCNDLPGRAPGVGLTAQVSASGSAGDSMRAMISLEDVPYTMEQAEEPTLLDMLESQGMTRGLFHGREAIIVRTGDRLPDGNDAISLRGIIAWRCGPHVFAAEDATGSGRELEIAEALYGAVEHQTLCGIGSRGGWSSSVVILAETSDTPGKASLGSIQALARSASWYYLANGYGRVEFDFAFTDAGGSADSRPWYNVGPSMSAYVGNEDALVSAAVQKAFAGASWPERAYLERVIVVFADKAERLGAKRSLGSAAIWMPDGYSIEVASTERRSRIHVSNLVLISENDASGTWVHELGHTLRSKYRSPYGFRRITDRYSYDQPGRSFGDVGPWDLMDSGNWWGSPRGTLPTHMSSYTKEAAGWLRYASAHWDQDYTLLSLEHQKIGDPILKLDDPRSDDPLCYYIVEARDRAYDAPESGVVIYHVTYDHEAGHAVVQCASPQQGEKTGTWADIQYQRPTLHGADRPDGAREYVDPSDTFRVRLLVESFSPYRATVRIERYSPRSVGALVRAN